MAYTDWSDKIFPSRIKIGDENTPNHPLHIIGEGNTDSTKSLQIEDSDNNRILQFLNNGSLQVGSGTNHDSSWLISTDGQREGIQIRDENNGNERLHQLRSDNFQFRNSDTNIHIAFTTFGGDGAFWQRRLDNSEYDWRISSDVGSKSLSFGEANEYRFYTNGTQGGFVNDQSDTAKPFHIQEDLLESIPIPAEDGTSGNNATTQNSPELRLVSRYWDGSQDQKRDSSIRHIMEDTTPSSRIGVSISSSEVISIKDNQRTGFNTTTPNSTVDVNGSFSAAILSGDTDYTATTSDHTLLGDASNGSFTFTLPSPSSVEGRIYNIKKIDSTGNAVNINVEDGSNIDGDTTQSITTQYNSIPVQAFGGKWWVL